MFLHTNPFFFYLIWRLPQIISGVLLLKICYFIMKKDFFDNLFLNTSLRPLKIPKPGSRVLIVVPHPDDELLGCGNFIYQSVKKNCDIKVLVLTNGDGGGLLESLKYKIVKPDAAHFEARAHIRQNETKQVLKTLGLMETDIIFLGYPDKGLFALWKNFWEKNKPYTSMYTGRNYGFRQNSYAPYTGYNLANDLERFCRDFKPDYVVYPHFYDRHTDHFSVNNFVKYTIAKMDLNVVELTYLIHRGLWPLFLRKYLKLPLLPPNALNNCKLKWYSLGLSNMELKMKDTCLHMYQSQLKNWIVRLYLSSFSRQNELFCMSDDAKLKTRQNSTNTSKKFDVKIINPYSDTLAGYLNKSADIHELTVTIDKNHLHGVIKTIGRPQLSYYQYELYFVFFHNDNSTSRLHLVSDSGKIKLTKITDHCLEELPEQANLSVEQNDIKISIPFDTLPDFRSFGVNALTYKNLKIIDRIGLRVIRCQRLNRLKV
jgi:LmbE family N-acetylglucosaminyl deacetylase